MFKNIFKKDSEKSLRKQVSKKYSSSSKEFKIKNLDIDLQFNKISQEDYDYAVLKINYHPDSIDYKLFKLDLDKKYNKIDEYTYEKTKLELTSNKETNEYQINLANLEYKFNKITENEKNKRIATVNNEPWFIFLDTKLDGEDFTFKWDCNQQFLDALAKMGYNQPDPEDNVMEWLKDGFMHTFDEDIDMVKRDIQEFDEAKTESMTSPDNPNLRFYS